ncbi:MAG: hypothetical protein BZY80_05110 [SAR202 cluster bacterium Io17-Chloro-G2]|nr:MAG: hypothetical protein BZY80_05110 [SAR202 cluster bacterium Io17-Chloro-G2]
MTQKDQSTPGSLPGLLEGVRVLDLTHHISGPYCTRLLSTLGAEVIKVERPQTGDPIRGIGRIEPTTEVHGNDGGRRETEIPPYPPLQRGGLAQVAGGGDAVSPWFLYLNSSKKSLTLDLKSARGLEIVKKLAVKAQIVVENFAPGAMDSLGLGYSQLSQLNPALVMTSISNYGQTGPHRDWKALEINLYAAGGLMNITGEEDRPPLKEGAPLAQLGAGQNAFVATMAALMYAEETGQGQHIDLSIAEYATNILENALMQYSYSGVEYSRVGNRGYGRAAWGIYPCGDGHVGIISGPDTNWPEIAKFMEREELADPRFVSRQGRLENADEIDALMLPWLLDHDKVDIFKAGQDHGLGFAYVATMQDILEMEQLTARGYFVELDHPATGPLKYPGPPINLGSNTSPLMKGGSEGDSSGGQHHGWVYRPAPLLGEHTQQTLEELGYDDSEVRSLRDRGIV